ncbi:hypothetical protein [Cryobacterium fucosi]|uniref:Uncharacterized protein n=1 Tax=Cryobacterium fucosi TaxID=1259157 RepID=A0A4R9B6N2_9MICO|nr:hypothetical protein [Cryobacterium fucosi]TFD76924.1 hypothetical protein E3T48_09230 [Cryobacterium fucosi]
MSTDTSTPVIRIPPVGRQDIGRREFTGPVIRTPGGGPRLEPMVDTVLRLLWQLVGVYVWLVLLAKRERPARATVWGRPRDSLGFSLAARAVKGAPRQSHSSSSLGGHR